MRTINIYNSNRSPLLATFEHHNEPFFTTKAAPFVVVFLKYLTIEEDVTAYLKVEQLVFKIKQNTGDYLNVFSKTGDSLVTVSCQGACLRAMSLHVSRPRCYRSVCLGCSDTYQTYGRLVAARSGGYGPHTGL